MVVTPSSSGRALARKPSGESAVPPQSRSAAPSAASARTSGSNSRALASHMSTLASDNLRARASAVIAAGSCGSRRCVTLRPVRVPASATNAPTNGLARAARVATTATIGAGLPSHICSASRRPRNSAEGPNWNVRVPMRPMRSSFAVGDTRTAPVTWVAVASAIEGGLRSSPTMTSERASSESAAAASRAGSLSPVAAESIANGNAPAARPDWSPSRIAARSTGPMLP